MSDANNGSVPPVPPSGDHHTPPPPTAPAATPVEPGGNVQPGGYAQPGGYSEAGGYSQPSAYAQPSAGYSQPGTGGQSKTLSLIGMIAGIVGILGAWIVIIPFVGSILGLFIPAAAVVLGFLGKKREGLPAKPLWLTAIITGFVALAIAVIAFILWAVAFAAGSSMSGFETY